VAELAARLAVPVLGPHRGDRFWIATLPLQGRLGGLRASTFRPERWLDQGDSVTVGETELRVLHCPGHTPGHVVFHDPVGAIVVVGDVLFRGSIGRTDLPGGSRRKLLRSIRERLFPLGDDVRVVTGHGPSTTIGLERRTNPFLRGS